MSYLVKLTELLGWGDDSTSAYRLQCPQCGDSFSDPSPTMAHIIMADHLEVSHNMTAIAVRDGVETGETTTEVESGQDG